MHAIIILLKRQAASSVSLIRQFNFDIQPFRWK
jgi:hypothetical protein